MHSDLTAAVARLRMRACWAEIPLLVRADERDVDVLFALAAAAVERCAFTGSGWDAAAEALRTAVDAADTDAQRARAGCEEAFFCYAQTVFAGVDRADQARQALRRAESLAGDGSPLAPLLSFRRGLMTENLDGDHDTARACYARAHQAAQQSGDELFLSFTHRHFAILDWKAGQVAPARDGFARSLELREKVGFLIGLAPALSGLARVSDEPEADRLRAESRRLVNALGLAERLTR